MLRSNLYPSSFLLDFDLAFFRVYKRDSIPQNCIAQSSAGKKYLLEHVITLYVLKTLRDSHFIIADDH